MPVLLILYLILAAAAIVLQTIGCANERPKCRSAGVIAAMTGAILLAIFLARIDSSRVTGAYVYKVNGVAVSGGVMNVPEAAFIGICGGALPSAIGMGIGGAVAQGRRRKQTAPADAEHAKGLKIAGGIVLGLGIAQLIGGAATGFLIRQAATTLTVSLFLRGGLCLIAGIVLLAVAKRRAK